MNIDKKEYELPLSNFALDNFISQQLSQLTENNTVVVSHNFLDSKEWISNFCLNSILGGYASKEDRSFIFFFLRRAEAAFVEYEYACETLELFITNKSKSPSLYFKALYHFEIVITMMWQAFALRIKKSGNKIYSEKDNSIYERLNQIYNISRHFDPSKISKENIHVIWVTNNGIQTEDKQLPYPELSYLELAMLLSEIGSLADDYSKANIELK